MNKELLREIKEIFEKFNLTEQTRAANVFPDQFVDVHSPASSGYVENNLPVVLKHAYLKMSLEGQAKLKELLKQLDTYFDNVKELTDIFTNITKVLTYYAPTIETSEIARIYRIAGDVSYFLQALILGSYKGLKKISEE